MENRIEIILAVGTRRRFAATFWSELAAARKKDPNVTRRAVFERLEDLYESFFHEELWTYDTFRHSKEFKGR